MQCQVGCEISLETAKLGEGRDRRHRWELWLQEVTFRPEGVRRKKVWAEGMAHAKALRPEPGSEGRGGKEAVEEQAGPAGPRRPWASLLSGAGKEPFGVPCGWSTTALEWTWWTLASRLWRRDSCWLLIN